MEKKESGGRMGRNRELRLGKRVSSELHGETSVVDRVLDCCPMAFQWLSDSSHLEHAQRRDKGVIC